MGAVRAFVHDVPMPRVVFGPGALDGLRGEVERLGASHVLLVAGGREGGPGERASTVLKGLLADRVTDVVMHVPVEVAARAVERARSAGADAVVTVGGGSATGLGKAVGKETGLPIVAVPTTFAGSELTPIWGLTDDGRKTTGRDPRVQPKVVVYDPELLATLPPELAAASGLNALAHCLEGLYAPDASPLVPVLAEEGIRVLGGALPGVVGTPGDLGIRAEALYGAWLAGTVLGAATMGVHHKLAHVLGGTWNLPHAQVHAALLPYVTAANASAAPEAMTRAARALGADPAPALWDLGRTTGAPTSLAALGWSSDAVGDAVAIVLTNPPVNPRPVEAGWIRDLLLAALAGRRPASSGPAA